MTLFETLREASQAGRAVGHFNISDLITLQGVAEAARELSLPVIVGVSEGERAFMGVRQVAALVKTFRDQPIFLNADHTHSLPKAVEAAQAGFDSVVFDLSTLPFEENLSQTRAAVKALKAINPSILVEGEIGDIGTGSEIHEEAPRDLALSTPDEARRFVGETGVDVLAPAVGNMHGLLRSMVRGEARKRLNIERTAEIKAAAGVFLTLHGGSGTDDGDVRRAIQAGITIVHVNTEIRLAWERGMQAGLAKNPEEIAPYKILPEARAAVKNVAEARLRLFAGL